MNVVQKRLELEIAQLKKQLEHERKAHAITTKRLESLRKAKLRPVAAGKRNPKLRGDIVRVIFGDCHFCKHNPPAISALLSDIKSFRPSEVIIGGDLIDCGGFLAAHHTLGYIDETGRSYEEDLMATSDFLNKLTEAAPNAAVHYIEGNHEARVERWCIDTCVGSKRDAEAMLRRNAPRYLLDLEKRGITYYPRSVAHSCHVPGWVRMGKVFFVHEISSAKNAASQAIRESGANVVYFHTHRADFSPLNTPGHGLVAAWCPGCLCELQPLWRHTRPTQWTHGYAIQFVSKSGHFQHINVSIENGQSFISQIIKGA